MAGLVLAGLPATAEAAASDGDAVITGTVTFHEANPDRTIEVFREHDGTWVADPALETTADPGDGSYTAQVPVGEPVKLRVSYGSPEYGYWYGDGFADVTAVPVQAEAGTPLTGIDLSVPAPARVSGRVVDRSGASVVALVNPMVNNDGSLRPLTTEPFVSTRAGGYSVIVPAGYETGILGLGTDGQSWAWQSGGGLPEPNFYLYLAAGEHRRVSDIVLPIGNRSDARLTATHSPQVRGKARKGAVLRTGAGSWNHKPAAIRYQWLRNGKAIRGATAPAYRLRRADVRKRISVRVTAYGAGNRTHAYAVSTRTRPVRAR
jgi:hypothetical protein